jgi:hypothetical protein
MLHHLILSSIIIAAYNAQYEIGFLFVVVFRYHSGIIGGLPLLVKGLYDYKKWGNAVICNRV